MKTHADRQYAAAMRAKAAAAMADEKPAAPELSKEEKITQVLHQCSEWERKKNRKLSPKPAEQIIGNVTLAALRVDGVRDFVEDEQIRHALHMAWSCLEFAKGALQAALERKVALAALLEPASEAAA